jgi:hypothetical protein
MTWQQCRARELPSEPDELLRQQLSGWAPGCDVRRLLVYLVWLVRGGVLGSVLLFWNVDVAPFTSERSKRGQEDLDSASRTRLQLAECQGLITEPTVLASRSKDVEPRKANERCETVRPVMSRPNLFTSSRW